MDRYPLRKLKQKILTGPEIINHGSEGSENFEGGTGFPSTWEGTDTKWGTGFIKLLVTDTKEGTGFIKLQVTDTKESTGFIKLQDTDTKRGTGFRKFELPIQNKIPDSRKFKIQIKKRSYRNGKAKKMRYLNKSRFWVSKLYQFTMTIRYLTPMKKVRSRTEESYGSRKILPPRGEIGPEPGRRIRNGYRILWRPVRPHRPSPRASHQPRQARWNQTPAQ